MSNIKYDTLLCYYNSEKYPQLEQAFSETFHDFDIMGLATYMLCQVRDVERY